MQMTWGSYPILSFRLFGNECITLSEAISSLSCICISSSGSMLIRQLTETQLLDYYPGSGKIVIFALTYENYDNYEIYDSPKGCGTVYTENCL